ncbi:hypothetical protein CQA40_03475 [Helicobacter sp. MIT 01-3238]|nr:hypothetical protein CQA40_03475 [Helicobacter sp. MIT 01-3238]
MCLRSANTQSAKIKQVKIQKVLSSDFDSKATINNIAKIYDFSSSGDKSAKNLSLSKLTPK